MTKFRIGGALISLASLVLAGLFIWGLTTEWVLWVIAAPVIIGFLAVLAIGFSIGRLMAGTQIEESPKERPKE